MERIYFNFNYCLVTDKKLTPEIEDLICKVKDRISTFILDEFFILQSTLEQIGESDELY